MAVKKPLTATAIALAFGFGGMAPALAQEATEAPGTAEDPAMQAPAEATAYTDEQLGAFVTAALEVSGIQQEAATSMMETEDQASQDELLQDANQQMVDAIENAPGITVPEYVEIAEAAETDPELRAQLEEMIMAAQQD